MRTNPARGPGLPMEIFRPARIHQGRGPRRLAKLGRGLAVAPDYYFRKGDLTKVHRRCRSSCRWLNSKPDAELVLRPRRDRWPWAKQQGGEHPGRLGIMGFCRGGRRPVWEYAAHNRNPQGGAVGLLRLAGRSPPTRDGRKRARTPARAPEMKAPVLGPLRRPEDTGHPGRAGSEAHERPRSLGGRQDRRVQDLSGAAPHGFHADLPARAIARRRPEDGLEPGCRAWFKKYKVLGPDRTLPVIAGRAIIAETTERAKIASARSGSCPPRRPGPSAGPPEFFAGKTAFPMCPMISGV